MPADPDLVHYERISESSTIFDAEAKGVLCVLEYLDEFEFGSSAIVLDSLSVMKCLESTDPGLGTGGTSVGSVSNKEAGS